MGLFADKLVATCAAEKQKYDGVLESASPLRERINDYWVFLGRPDLDGGDNVPWSAAFISYMVHLSGAGSAFPYSAQHSVYFYRTINDRVIQKKTSFWGYPIGAIDIAPGDILGMNRSGAPKIDYDWARHNADYLSHSDIVVAVDAQGIHTIGGNVGHAPGEIGRKLFVRDGEGWVNANGRAQFPFVVIRSFLP
ncbi:DUF2272 domain-containing protein [Sphingomonas sp. AR_OL41]|uniref:DUF2272 domain-containing protein n=1 Tax=Sphingomonas sp. AR_OL41 TaxID=3042729 RepID=UPI0024811CE8|nr:DUF2272 domain-containing protein [Sphingomonas sp. AR_OL41]MDH7975369.1 DUF2272 domain-containing protein [Sphingomonas sp. AR_OL41]